MGGGRKRSGYSLANYGKKGTRGTSLASAKAGEEGRILQSSSLNEGSPRHAARRKGEPNHPPRNARRGGGEKEKKRFQNFSHFEGGGERKKGSMRSRSKGPEKKKRGYAILPPFL